ncbi:MAG TPA: XTP/dITP diphosphatase [bacterium]|nr:XTP/dITP diphosphatase [bacterium]
MSDSLRVVLATKNHGKVAEIKAILGGLPIQLATLEDFPEIESAREDGATFEENAIKKARSVWQATCLTSVADDSGLEVDALEGAPGIFSARFAGEGASYEANNRKLLGLLQSIPDDKRTARFVCVAALFTRDGSLALERGTLEGIITRQPRGQHGFGYDPVFYVPAYGQTVAELSEEVKNAISHRAKAFAGIRRRLGRLASAL